MRALVFALSGFTLCLGCMATTKKRVHTRCIDSHAHEFQQRKYVSQFVDGEDKVVAILDVIDDERTPQPWDRFEWWSIERQMVVQVDSVDSDRSVWKRIPGLDYRKNLGSLQDYLDKRLAGAWDLVDKSGPPPSLKPNK